MALAFGIGGLASSITIGPASALAAVGLSGGTAIFGSVAIVVVSAEVAKYSAAVIGVVVIKEMADHLITKMVTGNLPDGGGSNNTQAPGHWGPRRGTGGEEYEQQVREHLGGPADKNLYYPDPYPDGCAYDAWNPDTQAFVDAKDATGNWFTDELNASFRDQKILDEARRQLEHAGSYSIEWWTHNEKATRFLTDLFNQHGIPIDVVRWP